MSFLLPDAGLLFWMLIVFGIVFFILAKYGFPVIISMVEERKLYIDKSLKSAREANEKLADINARSEALLKTAHEEQARIMREALSMRDRIVKEAREKAEEERAEMLEETRRIIRMEKEDAMRDIRRQVALVSVEIAQKLLRKELSDSTKQYSLIEEFVDETMNKHQDK